ncbi:MAG: DUF1778 domain-containing protein [Desulfobulbaceae bacterium]|jgi:uncharacterized protein (DUF1778 family)|nr:DUF1778 domain-containing protein [Desulfobulbaceae bacterium]
MSTLNGVANKRETLNIRIKPEERSLIDHAARMRGKNRTDFILDAVRLAAEETLLDQVIIMATPEAYDKFLAQLEMPPNPNSRLLKTMQTPAPWEKA